MINMNKYYIEKIIEKILDKNEIYGTVNVYQIGQMDYKVNITFDYEEYLKMVCVSETEITDKMNIEIDFIIRDE